MKVKKEAIYEMSLQKRGNQDLLQATFSYLFLSLKVIILGG